MTNKFAYKFVWQQNHFFITIPITRTISFYLSTLKSLATSRTICSFTPFLISLSKQRVAILTSQVSAPPRSPRVPTSHSGFVSSSSICLHIAALDSCYTVLICKRLCWSKNTNWFFFYFADNQLKCNSSVKFYM